MAGLTVYANHRNQLLHDRPRSFLVILTVVLSCAWCTTSFSELVLFRRDQHNQRHVLLNERVLSSAMHPLPHSHSCISRTVSCFGQKENDECDRPVESGKFISSRRTMMMGSAAVCWGVMLMGDPKVTHAACLTGDTDPSCIGIYKVPLDDAILKYVDTPENLARFAPGIKWVKLPASPKTYKEATVTLSELAHTCQEKIPELVLKGQLTEAGVILLDSIPRLTLASRVVLSELEKDDKNKMRSMRAEAVFPELFIKLSQTDILMGQALRGELGVSAVAQIQILAILKDANQHWDELLPVLE